MTVMKLGAVLSVLWVRNQVMSAAGGGGDDWLGHARSAKNGAEKLGRCHLTLRAARNDPSVLIW